MTTLVSGSKVESMDALCAPMKRLPSWNSSDAAVDTQQ